MGISYQQETQLKKRRRFISRANLILVFIAIMCAGSVYLLFFAKLFDVRTVEVRSTATIPSDTISSLVPRQKNIFFVSHTKLETILRETFPRIDEMVIQRQGFHTLVITIRERIPVGLWCLSASGGCYYYDSGGVAFSEVASSSGFLFIAVRDERDREINLGDLVAPDDWREHFQEIKKLLQFSGLQIAEIKIPADSYGEFHIITREGWVIYYDNDTNVRRQTNDLLQLLKEKITPEQRKKLEYVDLRIDERIYYKMR